MAHLDLILTLTGGLGAALVFGFLTQKIGLSPIVGYLLAGVVVGPFTPGFVANPAIAQEFAELGVVLLMFGVGLHFHLEELLAVRKVAIPGALVGVGVAVGLAVVVTRLLGWNPAAGVVYGLCISIASTVVLLRVLSENDALHTPAGHVAVGWLIVEDLFTVLVLVLLPILLGPNRESGGLLVPIALAFAKIAALVVFTLLVGRRVIPLVLGYVAKTRSRELFTLTVLVIALGIAVGSAELFGVSMALGAFLAGMVVGQSEFSTRAASEALPLRDAFAVLFFVSMGMLFNPSLFLANLPLAAATFAVVLLGKPFAALLVMLGLGQPVKAAASVALSLTQIGEFSFVVAAAGRELGVLPDSATQALVVVSIVTITLNPMVFGLSAALTKRLARGDEAPLSRRSRPAEPGHRAVVVGYGPVGRSLAGLLRENEIEPTVVELNHETLKAVREAGINGVYGDASQREILTSAGILEAGSIIFSASSFPVAAIQAAKELNPDVFVIARAGYVSEVGPLTKAGAHVVVSTEAEVALAMTERVLSRLGATADQLDRARDRVRKDLEEAK